eukprot:786156-Rhodomonas_salina.3
MEQNCGADSEEAKAEMRQFIDCKVRAIAGQEEAWGADDGPPPCVSYVLQLYRMLLKSVTFPSEEARAEYARKLRAVCQLLFGLDAPPPALLEHIVDK